MLRESFWSGQRALAVAKNKAFPFLCALPSASSVCRTTFHHGVLCTHRGKFRGGKLSSQTSTWESNGQRCAAVRMSAYHSTKYVWTECSVPVGRLAKTEPCQLLCVVMVVKTGVLHP